MKYDEIIRNRYSVREYQNKVVDKELVYEILENGRVAPTAGCKNPVVVYILNDEQIIKLKEATQYTFGSKNIFLICYDNNISYRRTQDGTDFGIQDVAIVTTHMMLKITELGLGSCWVGSFYSDKVSKIFNLPNNIIPGAILPFGYISENNKPNPRHFDRRNIQDFARKID